MILIYTYQRSLCLANASMRHIRTNMLNWINTP